MFCKVVSFEVKKEVREGYKITELGEIPDDWEIVNTGDIFDFSGGLSISRANLGNEGILYLHYGDIHKRNENYIHTEIDAKWLPRVEANYEELKDGLKLSTGTVVFADASEDYDGIGKSVVIFNEDEIPFVAGLHTIVAKDEDNKLDSNYKRYCFETKNVRKQFRALANGTSVYGISRENIKKIKILNPPIQEQKKIAEILSTVDEQIENTEKLIQKNQELKKGLMQQLLTKGIGHTEFKKTEVGEIPKEWEVKKLDEIVEKERKITYGIVQPGEYTENGVHVIRAKDYSFGWVDNDEIFKTSDIIEKSYTRSRVKTGDLLLTIVGSVGNLAIVPLRLNEANITQQTARIAIDNNIYNSKFYYYYLESEKAKKEINKYLKSGVQPSLNLSDVNKFKIVVPLLEEQKKIARILSGLDEKLEEYKNKKEKLKEVKIGLIQQLLVGRIRVS